MGTDNESELESLVLSVVYDAGIYDGEDPESALDCIRQELDGYSKLMWRIQRLCHADSAKPDDVEASIQKLVSEATQQNPESPFSREGDQVTLTMEAGLYQALLIMLGVAVGSAFERDEALAYSWVDIVNQINNGNPHFVPYRIPDKYQREANDGR